jgi:tripartite ATP-independent transporter DctM subunit
MGFVCIAAFTALFIIGFPVVLAIAIPAIIFVILEDVPLELVSQRMTYALDSFPLVAVPVFIYVGNLMNQAGITRRIFRFADTLVGRFPGGLAQVNIFASLIFSGMSGAALADVGGLGRIEVKAMVDRGFRPEFAGAVTVASAIVGPIFPPSIPLIIYGSVTSVSIVQLLLSGIIPAIICVTLLMATTVFLAKPLNLPRAERWPTRHEVWRDMRPALRALVAPVILVAGMLLGLFTPTEAASVTVIYVIAISALIYRELKWAHLLYSALETIKTTSAILIIISAASLFGWILAVEQVPQMFTKGLLEFSRDPVVLLLIANVVLLIAGMFLDSTTATLLIIPILTVPLHAAGVDPVHLGVVAIFNLMLGLVTPPMGLALFLITDIAKVSMQAVLRALVPYYIPLVLTLIMLTFVPEISLFIPKMIR